MADRIRALHEQTLYPTLRVTADKATGSGTIIASVQRTDADEDGELGFNTYVLTNHHVVSSAIRVEKTFDPAKGRYVTKDYRDLVRVEVFDYKNLSTITSRTTADAAILAYHEKRDIVLLRLKTNQQFDYVAKILPSEKARDIHIYDPLVTVGCGLGQPPFPTTGWLTGKDVEIDHFPYWQTSCPSIFGNSGGAIFLDRTLEFIGIPSRVAVSGGMFGGSAVTHLSYFIPPMAIAKFLNDEGYHFLVDPLHTEAADLKAISERKKDDKDPEDDDK
jgi:S1-C subfamily serine protease